MQKLRRSINIGFRVNEEEHEKILEHQKASGITSLRAYLLRMATVGAVIQVDLSEVKENTKLLRSISNNINQMAKVVNSCGYVHKEELHAVLQMQERLWQQQDKIIRSLAEILESN